MGTSTSRLAALTGCPWHCGFLPGPALSPGLQLSSCECVWDYNVRTIWTLHKLSIQSTYFNSNSSIFVGNVLMTRASPSPGVVHRLVFLLKCHQIWMIHESCSIFFFRSFNSFVHFYLKLPSQRGLKLESSRYSSNYQRIEEQAVNLNLWASINISSFIKWMKSLIVPQLTK